MKKTFIILGSIFGLLLIVLIALATVDFNRMGKDNVYVQITEDGKLEETRIDTGEVVKRYLYDVTAYDEDGEALQVEFSAAKNLRVGAYLMLYVKNGNEVTSYDEVQEKDIPKDALVKIK